MREQQALVICSGMQKSDAGELLLRIVNVPTYPAPTQQILRTSITPLPLASIDPLEERSDMVIGVGEYDYR